MQTWDGTERRQRGKSQLGELYDALIGTPGKKGTLELIDIHLTALDGRVSALRTEHDEHIKEHEREEIKGEAVRSDLRRAILPIVLQGTFAIAGAVFATLIMVQRFAEEAQKHVTIR